MSLDSKAATASFLRVMNAINDLQIQTAEVEMQRKSQVDNVVGNN
jgi:hypothetical protein